METLKTIFERRAVRRYRAQMMDDDLLDQILDAGRMASSAMNGLPWKFYVVTHRDTIAAFSKTIMQVLPKAAIKLVLRHPLNMIKTLFQNISTVISRNNDPIFHGAPVVIFITSPKDNEWAGLETGMCGSILTNKKACKLLIYRLFVSF